MTLHMTTLSFVMCSSLTIGFSPAAVLARFLRDQFLIKHVAQKLSQFEKSKVNFTKERELVLTALCITLLHGCAGSSNDMAGPAISVDTRVTEEPKPSQGNTSTDPSPEEPELGEAFASDNDDLISISNLSFAGAFSLPVAQDSVSSLNYSAGIIEVDGDSLFIIGHNHDDAIAEFVIPELVTSTTISELNSTGAPRQEFVKIIDRAAFGNPESLDEIAGLELVNDSLVINAIEYYDAPGDNQLSTLVVNDAYDLKNSEVSAFRSMQGFARAAGWMSAVPDSWQSEVGATHISGHSSGGPIISRLSVGPSAFAVDLEKVVTSDNETPITSTELLGFSLEQPLSDDLFNTSGQNNLWTHISHAKFGFIVPGTRTYMTLGWSGGHDTGVGYKITQNDGNLCGGYCSTSATDNYNYYWLWDLDELIETRDGSVSPESIRPYEFGQFDLPFQTDGNLIRVGGASYDSVRDLLYVSLPGANNELGEYDNPPVIVAFKIDR